MSQEKMGKNVPGTKCPKTITEILQMSLKCNIKNIEIRWEMMYN